MADNRDVLRKKTPPAGVRAQTAKPLGESWDGDLTPTPEPPGTISNETLDARARSLKVTASATLSSVSDLRKETSAQISTVRSELKADIAEVKSDVKELSSHFTDMREAISGVKGQLEILPRLVDSLEQARHVTFRAEADIGRERAISEIRDESGERETRRELKLTRRKFKLKLAAIVGTIATIISTVTTAAVSHSCHASAATSIVHDGGH